MGVAVDSKTACYLSANPPCGSCDSSFDARPSLSTVKISLRYMWLSLLSR